MSRPERMPVTPAVAVKILEERAKHYLLNARRQGLTDKLQDQYMSERFGMVREGEDISFEQHQLQQNAGGLADIAKLIRRMHSFIQVLAAMHGEGRLLEAEASGLDLQLVDMDTLDIVMLDLERRFRGIEHRGEGEGSGGQAPEGGRGGHGPDEEGRGAGGSQDEEEASQDGPRSPSAHRDRPA